MRQPIAFAVVSLAGVAALFSGCTNKGRGDARQTIVVFHAGSLSVPFLEIVRAFEDANPEYRVVREASGSRAAARKISDLGRACDVFASADYRVIEDLLEPEYASWSVPFARNEICLARRNALESEFSPDNSGWLEELASDDVTYGRSDPDSDPCGYRTVQVLTLAEAHYAIPGIARTILEKDVNFVRPKGSDLVSLLETGAVDYAFVYRSVALQHGLSFTRLPDELNLGNPSVDYSAASALISGKSPGSETTDVARPIVYALTIPVNAPNPEGARAFVRFLLDANGGLSILERHHQLPAVPSATANWDRIPDSLKEFALPEEDTRRER